MSNPEKSKISQFFREDQQVVQDFLGGENDLTLSDSAGIIQKESLPVLEKQTIASEEDAVKYWIQLRSFFRNGHVKEGISADLTPFILAPMYTKKLVAASYPIWIPTKFKEDQNQCLSLKELVSQAIVQFAPDDGQASILKEHIDTLVQLTRALFSQGHRLSFNEVKSVLIKSLEEQLKVSGDDAQVFSSDLDKLAKALPNNGYLVDFSNQTSWHLLSNAIGQNYSPLRAKIASEIERLVSKLKELLNLESLLNSGKQIETKDEDSFSFASSMVNFDEISSMAPKDGSEGIGEERAKRITESLAKLDRLSAILESGSFIFIEENLRDTSNIPWEDLFENHMVERCESVTACLSLENCFEKTIKVWEELYKYKRIAELELKNAYRANAHDDFFDHYNWQHFTEEELQACPAFVLIAEDEVLFHKAFHSLSELFSRSLPIRIVAIQNLNEKQIKQEKVDQVLQTPIELGALMLSHKNIFVHQCTSVSPLELYHGFREGLEAFAPSFFYVLEDLDQTSVNSYLAMSAAMEGRDFPGFTFRGLLGTPWSSRFDIHDNPQSELDWPLHKRTVKNASGDNEDWELAFTYPDYLATNKEYYDQFMVVPSAYWDEDLIPVDQFLLNNTIENIGKVPFIWMSDSSNTLHKVAVSWDVIMAARERHDFWSFLQENSGINNFHVQKAIEKTKKELTADFEKQIAELDTKHKEALEKARTEEAETVMDHLTSVLLDLDLSNPPEFADSTNPTKQKEKKEDGPKAVPSEEKISKEKKTGDPLKEKIEVEEVEDVLTNDPYIDTAMCTSCNECIQKNGAVFKYNADKMAYIADPKAGSFKDIVEAAEACPVAIIHPGTPLDPAESGLEELIKRASKFN